MKARGRVPVGAPVNAAGAATADLAVMVGIAGRQNGFQEAYRDGDEFELVTDKDCKIQLVGPGDLIIGNRAFRFMANEQPYVSLRGGRIIGVQELAR